MIISSSDVNNKDCQLAIWKSTNYVNLSHIQIWQISAIYDENKLEIQTNIRYGYKGKAPTNTKSKQHNKKEQKQNNRKKTSYKKKQKLRHHSYKAENDKRKVLNGVIISCLIHYTHHDVVIQKPNMKFEDTKRATRIRISKKKRQHHNGQKKKYKSTNNDLQNIYIKLKIE